MVALNEEDSQKIEALKEALSRNRIILEFKKLTNQQIKGYVKYLVNNYREAKTYFENYLATEKVLHSDVHGNRVYCCIANVLLTMNVENGGSICQADMDVFYKYLERGNNYLSEIYNMDTVSSFYRFLECEEEQYLVLMFKSKAGIAEGDSSKALCHYNEAMKVYPCMEAYAVQYRGILFNKASGKIGDGIL